MVVTNTDFPSLIDFQIVTKDKQIYKIVLENEKQYKTLIYTGLGLTPPTDLLYNCLLMLYLILLLKPEC